MPIADPKIEQAEPEKIRQIQLERLQATLNRAYRHVALYREKFDAAGILPEEIRSFEDMGRLPCTSREDLLQHQPYGLLAVPLQDVVRLHPSAGAGGPVVVGYTQNDLSIWAGMAGRALASVGVTAHDVAQITLDYAVHAAGMGAQSGAEKLGASVVPCSSLSPKRQAELLYNYRATVLIATANQALLLGPHLQQMDRGGLSLRSACIVAQVWSAPLRQRLQDALGVEVFCSYGLSEMAAPGLATECEAHNGLHVSEDNIFVEIVNPETGEVLPPGETGELVITTLTREATPMIRYRTGDLTALHTRPCSCGRTSARIEPSNQRADDILLVNGIRVAPHQIQEVVDAIQPDMPIESQVVELDGQECLELRIAIDPSRLEDEIKHLEMLKERTRAHLLEYLGLEAQVRLVEAPRKGWDQR